MTDKKPSSINLNLSFSEAMRATINRASELRLSAERVIVGQNHDRPEEIMSLCQSFDIATKRFHGSLEALENAKEKTPRYGMTDEDVRMTKTFFNHMHTLGNVVDPALDICIDKKALSPPKFF
jgi:hypothetical protein